MDQRVQELKALKKACNRSRRKAVGFLRTFCLMCLVFALALVPLALEMPVYPAQVTAFLASYGVAGKLVFTGGVCLFGLLFVLFAILWASEKKNFKKSQVYLNWKTLRTTLRAEKQAAGQ